jgi:CheY-like chemotaxis protein
MDMPLSTNGHSGKVSQPFAAMPSPFAPVLPDAATGWPEDLGIGAAPADEVQDTAHAQELVRWQDLLGQVGRELAEPLTSVLDRVITLTTTGRIDRHGLRALREDVERARHAGMLCQQMSRLASGRIRQTHERVHLTHTVQSVLAQRARELQARGLVISQSMLPVEVLVDASMLFALLNHLADWWLEAAHGQLELRIDMRNTWPVQARLSCSFAAHAPDVPPPGEDVMLTRASTLRWHLLEQTARSMGLVCTRQVRGHLMSVELEFPATVTSVIGDTMLTDDSQGFEDSINSRPLTGSHVLVVAGRKDLRQQVRESLKDMGLVLDVCHSVKDAVAFCKGGLPHAIVFESALRSPLLDRLIAHIRAEVPEFVFVELLPEGRTFDISSLQASGIARVGGEGLAHALPSALVYELSRGW